ncbi:MAG: 50S ribosomal protein L9 [Candidatus Moduliflexus flocculans]|nr:50S ribosomal protein L9 [Candidatus Moduliflexus flocculans]
MIKDVYKLGRAGDIKKVADGYGRNFLIPQGLAVLATAGALKQAEKVRKARLRSAAPNRTLNSRVWPTRSRASPWTFAAKAGETGKLYGSITTQDVATAIYRERSASRSRQQQVDMQPIRNLGEFTAHVHLHAWTWFPK